MNFVTKAVFLSTKNISLLIFVTKNTFCCSDWFCFSLNLNLLSMFPLQLNNHKHEAKGNQHRINTTQITIIKEKRIYWVNLKPVSLSRRKNWRRLRLKWRMKKARRNSNNLKWRTKYWRSNWKAKTTPWRLRRSWRHLVE